MQHTRRHRAPEHARSVGEHAGVRRAPCDEDACAKLGGAAGWRRSQRGRARYSAVSGERGGESSRGGEDAGAHARHMRRRTQSGLCQLTFPPRPISRLSSASLPALAASYTALPIESLIASAALYRPSPARTPAHSGGGAHAWLRGDAREAAARTPSWCACSSPSELGWRRQTWYTTPYHPIPPATPGSRGAERVRRRPSGSTRALGNPPLACLGYRTFGGSPSVKQPKGSLAQSVKSP